MLVLLAHRWWLLALRGAAAIAFGVLTAFWPGATLAVLVALFGAYALVDGVVTLASLGTNRVRRHRAPVVVTGIAGIVAGLLTFLWPGITALALLYVVAAWALVTGVAQVTASVRLRREIGDEWRLALAGTLGIVAGVLLAVLPGVGLLALTWLVGAFAITLGCVLVTLAVRMRAENRDLVIDLRDRTGPRERVAAR